MYAYVGNIIGTTVPMSVGNPTDFLLNPTNKRDPTGLVAPMADINGGGGESACPGGTYDTFDDCVDAYTNAVDDPNAKCWCLCYDECGDDDGGSGGDEWECPEWAEEFLGCMAQNMGISAAQNPGCYYICAPALVGCIGATIGYGVCVGGLCACAALEAGVAFGLCAHHLV